MVFITDRRNVPDNSGNRSSRDVVEYAADEVQDIKTLPGTDEVSGGSTAFVINTGDVYMLGSQGWRKM
jgi:hypothetical protein